MQFNNKPSHYMDMDSKSKGTTRMSSSIPPGPPSPPPPPSAPFRNRPRPSNPKRTTSNNPTTSIESSESEELQRLVHAPPFWKSKKRLSKQLSMCETLRDKEWEKRRRNQILKHERNKSLDLGHHITDDDFKELKGSIELGFGFSEAAGQRLCNTFPALDLYLAVNRQLSSSSPGSTPHSQGSMSSMGTRSSSFDSPTSDDSWKICGPGDDPQQVKTKLRHWAQAVACSVMQSY